MLKEDNTMATKKNEDDRAYERALDMLRADSDKQKGMNEVTGVLTPIRNTGTAAGGAYAGNSGVKAPSVSLAQGYSSPLTQQKNDALNAYMNRGPFKYDINTDALYQQYKDKFIQQGQAAMQDTMGQAAALTGGYGSSYAQNVGQQAYNQHLLQLNDVVPELYQMAYGKYQDEGNELLQRYSMLSGEEAEAFNRWYQQNRDAVADQRYADEWAYQKERDAVSDRQWEKSFGYQQQRDKVSDQRYEAEQKAAASKITEEAAYAMALTGDYSGLAALHGISLTQAEALAEASGMTPNSKNAASNPIYGYTDPETGLNSYYIDGKKYEFGPNVSPVSGTVNPDAEYGTFNGYQPDNVGKDNILTEAGIDTKTGVVVYKDTSGKRYTYNASKNKYEAYDGYVGIDTPGMRRWRSQQFDPDYYGGHQNAAAYYEKSIEAALKAGTLTPDEAAALMLEYGIV